MQLFQKICIKKRKALIIKAQSKLSYSSAGTLLTLFRDPHFGRAFTVPMCGERCIIMSNQNNNNNQQNKQNQNQNQNQQNQQSRNSQNNKNQQNNSNC